MSTQDPFNARATLDTPYGPKQYARLDAVRHLGPIDRLPYSIRVLLESCLRNLDGHVVTEEHVRKICQYDPRNPGEEEIPFMPGRVVLQDFTGVPCVVDLAAIRRR
jgi:aconitate hydratase